MRTLQIAKNNSLPYLDIKYWVEVQLHGCTPPEDCIQAPCTWIFTVFQSWSFSRKQTSFCQSLGTTWRHKRYYNIIHSRRVQPRQSCNKKVTRSWVRSSGATRRITTEFATLRTLQKTQEEGEFTACRLLYTGVTFLSIAWSSWLDAMATVPVVVAAS